MSLKVLCLPGRRVAPVELLSFLYKSHLGPFRSFFLFRVKLHAPWTDFITGG